MTTKTGRESGATNFRIMLAVATLATGLMLSACSSTGAPTSARSPSAAEIPSAEQVGFAATDVSDACGSSFQAAEAEESYSKATLLGWTTTSCASMDEWVSGLLAHPAAGYTVPDSTEAVERVLKRACAEFLDTSTSGVCSEGVARGLVMAGPLTSSEPPSEPPALTDTDEPSTENAGGTCTAAFTVAAAVPASQTNDSEMVATARACTSVSEWVSGVYAFPASLAVERSTLDNNYVFDALRAICALPNANGAPTCVDAIQRGSL